MYRSNSPNIGIFPLKKTELTPFTKTPNPGILRALFSVSLQNGLRLCENDPLFDRKLLEYLYEQGVRIISDKTSVRATPPDPKDDLFGVYFGLRLHFS